MSHHRAWVFLAPLALAGLLLWTGCDNTLEPFDEETGQFSIQGLLTLSQETHFIRVKDLNDPITPDSTRTLDVTVTLENTATGTTEQLTDSVVVFDGIFTHNFRTDQDIQPGVTYELTVERPDGRSAQAIATMPERTELEVSPAKPEAIRCDRGIVLKFQNVPAARFLRIFVGLKYERDWKWVKVQDSDTELGISPANFVQEILSERILRSEFGDNWRNAKRLYCTLLDTDTFRIAYTHFGPDWPPDSVLANPIESSVKNGLGVFGGVHRDTLFRTVTPGPE